MNHREDLLYPPAKSCKAAQVSGIREAPFSPVFPMLNFSLISPENLTASSGVKAFMPLTLLILKESLSPGRRPGRN